jgi:hypothetical protein
VIPVRNFRASHPKDAIIVNLDEYEVVETTVAARENFLSRRI